MDIVEERIQNGLPDRPVIQRICAHEFIPLCFVKNLVQLNAKVQCFLLQPHLESKDSIERRLILCQRFLRFR